MAYGESYDEFVNKFKVKKREKTTDDCYTPQEMMDAITKWAIDKYNLQGFNIVRPFWPDTDYQKFEYKENDVVIDNPPFSILSKIVQWYDEKNIKYFLFAPTLHLFSTNSGGCNYVVSGETIAYENGALVNTSFVTNLGDTKILISPSLKRTIKEIKAYLVTKKDKRPKYSYPDNVINGAMASSICNRAKDEIELHHVYFARGLDEQKKLKKGIYGAGFILSDEDTEKIKGLRPESGFKDYIFNLSDREKEILKDLNNV